MTLRCKCTPCQFDFDFVQITIEIEMKFFWKLDEGQVVVLVTSTGIADSREGVIMLCPTIFPKVNNYSNKVRSGYSTHF